MEEKKKNYKYISYILGCFLVYFLVAIVVMVCVYVYFMQLKKEFSEPIYAIAPIRVEEALQSGLREKCDQIVSIDLDENTLQQGSVFAVSKKFGMPVEDEVSFKIGSIEYRAVVVYQDGIMEEIKSIKDVPFEEFSCPVE